MELITFAPDTGGRMPNFKFKSIQGNQVQVGDYRHRCNLIVTFISETESNIAHRWLAELARRAGDFTFEDANVLVVVKGTPEAAMQLQQRHRLPFPVLLNEDGVVPPQVGAESPERGLAIYVLDRFGQICAASTLSGEAKEGASGETIDELVQWLAFVNLQCPECGVPEWPAA